MWDAFGEGIFMITTNPIIRKDGAVVMGRGIALEAKTRFPQLPYDFGNSLSRHGDRGVDYIGEYDHVPIYYFMVKDHWAAMAYTARIQFSVNRILREPYLCHRRIDLNFPGIGNGGLTMREVLPIVTQLPDNVHVWEKA